MGPLLFARQDANPSLTTSIQQGIVQTEEVNMNLRIPTIIFVALALATVAFGQAIAGAPSDAFQVRYAANLNVGDSVINISNAGTQNAAGALTNICANVYAFSPDEQLISCCSCTVTPNALVSLSAVSDLISNTLTPARPNSIVVKLIATAGTACNASNVPVANLAAGMVAWGTTVHAAPTTPVTYAVTETQFAEKGLSAGELARLTSFCGFIQANGSGFGICRSCRLGGQGAVKQ
jgi:hypothetical protein